MKKIILMFILLLFVFGLICEDFPITLPFRNIHLFNKDIIDAKAEALGNCSLLGSSGANNTYNNASLLSALHYPVVNMNFNYQIRKETSQSSDYHLEYKYPFQWAFSGFAISLPIKMPKESNFNIGIGAGYQNQFDISEDLEMIHHSNDERYHSKTTGMYSNITFAGGVSFKKKFLMGLSISVPLENKFEKKETSEISESSDNGTLKGYILEFSSSYKISYNIIIAFKIIPKYHLIWESTEDSDVELNFPVDYFLAGKLTLHNIYHFYSEISTRNYADFKMVTSSNSYLPYKKFKNGYAARLGVEIESNITIMVGLFIQSVPIYKRDETDFGAIHYEENPLNEIGVTSGFGFKILDKCYLDFFGVYSFLNYNDIYYDYHGISQDVKTSRYKFKVGSTVKYSFD